jgi:periplasmic copper chaperone A
MRKAILVTAAGALLAAPAASAHVTVNPDEVPADSFARLTVRVPTERPEAATTTVTVRLPQGLHFVSFQPKPGWARTVITEKLDPPATVFGERISERIATVTWTGGRIAPGEFDEFGLSAKVPNAPGRTLVFPALQTYEGGEVVRWIGSPDADEPAARVTLGPKEPEDGGTTTSAGGGGQASGEEAEDEEEDETEGRTNLALGLGVGGLVAGLAGLVIGLTGRRRGT